ncbi:hypothetical protein [Dokdonia sinensis]|nr:hypothetical protein [Dokdonia sinensis]
MPFQNADVIPRKPLKLLTNCGKSIGLCAYVFNAKINSVLDVVFYAFAKA